MTTEETYRLEFEKAVEELKPAILEASANYSTDVLVSAMIEVGMRLSFLKYGTMGMVSLLADILHTTATSGAMIEEMQKAAKKSDSDIMNAFAQLGEETKH
jgi:hypothetical protein